MANVDLTIHRAVQEIMEMLHFAQDMRPGLANKSLKLQIKTAGTEEENEACLFHLKLHSSSSNAVEFMSSLTRTQDRELLPVLSAMQLTEDESHLCVQYLQSPGLVTQKSFQVRHGEGQSQLVLHCISTSTKSSKKPSGVTIHIRILLSKHLMMLECQKMYKYLWLYKIFNPKIQLEFNMKIFENLCESDFSCTSMNLSGSPLEICGDASYFLRNTSHVCTSRWLVPVCSEITQLSVCEGTGDSSYPNTVTLQVVAHMNYVQGRGGGGRLGTCATGGLINLYLFGPEAVPVFPVLKDTSTQYNPLEQIPWNMYGLNIHATSASMEDRFSSHFAALLESTVPQTHKTVGSKFALFIHVHFGIDGQTIQAKLDFCAWLQKNYPSILTDHQQEIDKVISVVVARLLKPHRETDKKTECYTKAIPNIVKSISYILSHSSNEEFRQQCFSLLSVNSSRVVESEVTDRLWNIASKRCGVRGQTTANNHSPIKTNLSKSDSIGCDLNNPNHDEASTGTSFTDPEQKSAEGGLSNLGQETSRERGFTDRAKETSIGSSYTDLEHEMFTSYCMGQGQETFNESSFTDLRNEISAGDGFTEGIRQETITGRAKEIYAENFTNSGFTEISQEYSTEGGSVKIEHENYTGSDFPFAVADTHTKGSFNTLERESSTGSDFTDQGQETLTRSGYLGLGHDTSVRSGFFGLRHETSAGSSYSGLGHEPSAGSSYSGLGHEPSAGSSFSGLGHETSAGSGYSGLGHEPSAGSSFSGLGHETSAGSGFSGLGHETSAGSGYSGLGHETSAGSGYSGLGHATSAQSGFFGLEQGTSAGSGFMVNTTPLIRTDKNSTQDDRCSFGLSNLAECYGESIRRRHIGDHCSRPRHFSSQIHAPSVGTQGRVYRDSMSSIHHGNDDDKSQEAEMFHPADTCTGIGPSGDARNQDGYPLYNSCNTGVSSQQNQHVTNTDGFNDLGQHRMTLDNLNFSTGQARDNYSFQGNDLGGQDHNIGAGDSFDDVLENVQQWLDEF